MLRLALLENLRRLATQIAADILNKKQAGFWADEMISTAEKDPKSLVLVIADMARSKPPMGKIKTAGSVHAATEGTTCTR